MGLREDWGLEAKKIWTREVLAAFDAYILVIDDMFKETKCYATATGRSRESSRVETWLMDLWHNVTLNWSDLCAAMGCHRTSVPGALIHVYPIGRSGTFYNFALVRDPCSFSIKATEEEFDRRKLPFGMKMPGLADYSDLHKSLHNRRYSLLPAWILMKHEREEGEPNPKVTVDEIDSSRLVNWLAINGNALSTANSSRSERQEMVKRASVGKSTRLLLASLDRKAVGRCLLFIKDHIASIHMMETIPELRRRRVATTIVLAALNRSKNEGAELLWLRTRKGGIGEKVYSKTGFRTCFDILTHTRTPDLEDVGTGALQRESR